MWNLNIKVAMNLFKPYKEHKTVRFLKIYFIYINTTSSLRAAKIYFDILSDYINAVNGIAYYINI